jgi:hypothetical protein
MKTFYKILVSTLLPVCCTSASADVAYSTVTVPAANVTQGSTNNIVYIVKADVTAQPATFNYIQFTLSGTHDADDLTTMNVYFNPATPTVSGGSTMAVNVPATFAAPHAYDVPFTYAGSQTIAAGSSGYFIIVVSVSNSGTNGNTFKIDGAANPVTFSYTTTPTVTNNQTNLAGGQTILAGTVTLGSVSVPAQNIAQAGTNNIVYIVKADVAAEPVVFTHIQFTLNGTMDNDDITGLSVFFNPTAPSLPGASTLALNSPANFAAPHSYDLLFNYAGFQIINPGVSGYFIITANVSNTGTGGNTIKVDGAAHPASFSYTLAPTVTNNQTDIAGIQTILAAGITFSTPTLAPANITQGSTNNILYVVKADVTSLPVTINRIQFNVTGTMDNNDLTVFNIYFNPTAPVISGGTILGINNQAGFAAPHAYDLVFNYSPSQTIAAGASGYFIIAANVDPTATVGNTVKINGAANPVSFTYTTGPTITNNQTDAAGVGTIGLILPLTLIDFNGNRSDSKTIRLAWTTASEYDTKEFDVEWSDDARNFSDIADLPAANYSTQLRQYNFVDNGRVNTNNYYRLKMVDNDGKFTYSRIIEIAALPAVGEILAFPNPFIKNLQLQVQSLQNKTVEFNLTDASCKRIASKSFSLIKGNNLVNWDLPNLPAGNYFISSVGGIFKTVEVRSL